MNRAAHLLPLFACLVGAAGPLHAAESARTAPPESGSRPNVLWLTAEDLSPHLGCYGDAYARTPNLDAFAETGVRYTGAFATAPVCSPARSCLITGMYATSLGTQRLRSRFPVPEEIRGFSALLRDAGYYCSNNVKTDYNLRDERAFVADAWDESSPRAHWRNRRPGQPFFAVFNFMTTHQSRTSVWPHEEFEKNVGSQLDPGQRHDPAEANLPPYYPDTAEARRAWARYHDCITRMDQEVAERLRELEADGLAGETVVFFYGDHGMGMPRGKRLLHDSGLRVPLILRFPEKWRHLAPAPPGATTDRLVSFVDFAPTVLSLCGVDVPRHMQGRAFLGPAAAEPRQYVYGARDRVDEVFDLARSARDGRWLYIRNFMPHQSWMPPERYSDGSTFRRELKRLAAAGRLNADQLTYAAPRRALEELYDTDADPHQLHNLADSPEHRESLKRMRAELRRWQTETRDAGFLTEPQVWQRIGDETTPLDLARDAARYPLARLLDTADRVGREDAWQEQVKLLGDEDDGVRYWAAVGLRAAVRIGDEARTALRASLSDSSPVVRVEAASALAHHGETAEALPVLAAALSGGEPEVALHAARALELLGPKARPVVPAMRQALDRAQKAERGGDMLMFIRFSLEAALENLEAAGESDPEKPNVVIILADDLGYADVSCYGGKIQTPHVDRLAAEGMRFTDAHSTSSVCTPTRYGLLTGRYNWRTKLQRGVLGGLSPRLIEPGRATLASLLKQQGYHTACLGKWHLGMDWVVKPGAEVSELSIEPRAQVFNVDFAKPIARGPNSVGFDYYYGISASLDMVPYTFIENDRVTSLPTEDRDFPMMHDRTPERRTRKGPTAPDFDAADVLPALARKSAEYIDQRAAAAREGRPFFLYVPLASPHTPILPTPEWQGKSGINPYADFVMQSDGAVGEILAALDRHDLADRTLVVFTSDNGCSPQARFDELAAHDHHPSGPLRGHKADLFEGGTRVPLVARWPGHIPAGTTSEQIVCQTDLLATVAEAVGFSLPADAGEDSISFLATLRRGVPSPRDHLVSHSVNGSFAIRRGPWKLLLCPDSGGWSEPRPGSKQAAGLPPMQLYNLDDDLGEQNNRVDRHPEKVRELTALLEQFVAEGRSTPGPRQPNHDPIDIRANPPK
jgi:arylsulfatase A-like enzyme